LWHHSRASLDGLHGRRTGCHIDLPGVLLAKSCVKLETNCVSYKLPKVPTLPKIVCLPSSQGVGASVMKNCEPLVSGPLLALLRIPAPVCFSSRVISSANFAPERRSGGDMQVAAILPKESLLEKPSRRSHSGQGQWAGSRVVAARCQAMGHDWVLNLQLYTAAPLLPKMLWPPRPVPVGSPPWIMKSAITR
jgi:hypothetical protein